jgi:hypothetical protein
MRSTIKYFISLALLVVVGVVCLAQNKPQDTARAKTPSKKPVKPKKDFTPTGIRIGTDVIDLIKTNTGKTFQGWEVNGDLGLANYYLAADIGSWSKNIPLAQGASYNNGGSYSNGGNYYRLGVDVNLLGKDPDRNMLFFGLRYGKSKFHESIIYRDSSVFGVTNRNLTSADVNGSWVELTSGLRVKIWKGLWMGYTARMKMGPNTKGGNPAISPYDMPGYGLVSNKPWWGFNYQVFWKFAWKKEKPIPKK